MIGLHRTVARLPLVGLFLLCLAPAASGDEPATTAPAPQIEPIDFIDNSRPPAADANPRRPAAATPVSPTGWGTAVFSPNGKILATVSVADGKDIPGEVSFWDVNEPKTAVRYEQPGRILVVAFSPDGELLAIGPNSPQSGLKLVDTKTGTVTKTLPGPVARTNAIAWSQDGSQVALASTVDHTIRVWNVAENKFVKAYEPEASSLYAVAFTETDQLLLAGAPVKDRDGLAIFDVAAGELLRPLKGHRELIETATFSANASLLASVGWDATLRVWDVAKGEETAAIKGHKKGIRTVSISADGKRVATANDREFKLWDGEKKELLGDIGAENTGAKFVSLSADGTSMISIARDGIARLWDAEKKTDKFKLERNAPPMVSMGEGTDGATADKPATAVNSDAPEPEAVQSLAYSRDGKWIALAREDGRISIRHADDGRVARELEGFRDVAACVAFSHDSQQIAAGSFDKSIKVWNVETGTQQAELKGHTNWIFSVAFSADGQTLASGSYDKTVKLWNIADSKEIATFSGHTAGVRSVCFTIDGQALISGSADRTAIVWNLKDHSQIAALKGHAAAIRGVACSPDGTTVATASEDATIKLWKTADWTERNSLPGAEGVMFWCLAFSPAGRTLAAGAFNGTVKLFDPIDGKERKTLQGPTEAITAVAFAPDAHEIVAGSIDKSLRRWKAETGATVVAAAKKGESEKPLELKPSEAATALHARLLDIKQAVLSLAYSHDGKHLVVGAGAYRAPGSLQFWDVSRQTKVWQSDDYKFGLPAIAFSPDEKRIITGSFADNFVRIYDAVNGKQLKEVRGHRRNVAGLAFSPNGKTFATACLDREVKLWDAVTNKEIKTFSGHSDVVSSIAFSHDGHRLLSGSYDRTARLWDIESGREIFQLKGIPGPVQQAIFSPDGQLIATASGGQEPAVRFYEATAGDFLLTLRGHRNKVEAVAFAPDGKLVATGSSDRTIRLWNPGSGAELLKLTQEGIVRAVAFSPDGKYLATGCDDKTVKLWDVTGFTTNPIVESDAQTASQQ